MSFNDIEERLIEAWDSLHRLPDRERAYLRVTTMRLWALASPTAGMSEAERADYLRIDRDEAPKRPALTRREVDRMEEALGWLDVTPVGDRRLIGLALAQLLRGEKVRWGRMVGELSADVGPHALRKRYERALYAIACLVNGEAEEKR